jgi:hypothetical protein
MAMSPLQVSSDELRAHAAGLRRLATLLVDPVASPGVASMALGPEPSPTQAKLVARLELHRFVADEILRLPEPYRGAVLGFYFGAEATAGRAGKSAGQALIQHPEVDHGIDLLRRGLDASAASTGFAWRAAMAALACADRHPG